MSSFPLDCWSASENLPRKSSIRTKSETRHKYFLPPEKHFESFERQVWRSMTRNWVYSRAVTVIGKRKELGCESLRRWSAKSKLFVLQSLRLLINKHKSEIRMLLCTLIVRRMFSVFCIDIISLHPVYRRCHARIHALAEKLCLWNWNSSQKVGADASVFSLNFTCAKLCDLQHQSRFFRSVRPNCRSK